MPGRCGIRRILRGLLPLVVRRRAGSTGWCWRAPVRPATSGRAGPTPRDPGGSDVKALIRVLIAVLALAVGGAVSAPAAAGPVAAAVTNTPVAGAPVVGAPVAPGGFGSVAPLRVLDTRSGTGAPAAAVRAGATVAVKVTGQGGVPATGVSAVVLNVTVTAPTAGGFITGYASGSPRPLASNLNFTAWQTVPNLVVAPVGADGDVVLYNGSPGAVHLLADLSGYYLAGLPAAAGGFGWVAPLRVLDTRSGTGAPAAAIRAGCPTP